MLTRSELKASHWAAVRMLNIKNHAVFYLEAQDGVELVTRGGDRRCCNLMMQTAPRRVSWCRGCGSTRGNRKGWREVGEERDGVRIFSARRRTEEEKEVDDDDAELSRTQDLARR